MGATVLDWQSLPQGQGWALSATVPGLSGPADYWVEALQPQDETVEIRAGYTSGPYAGQAALTENRFGKGRVYYLGWYPMLEQAQALVAYLAEVLMILPIADLPNGLMARVRGDTVILLNFTDLAQAAIVAGQPVRVGPRDIVTVPQMAQE